MKLPGIEMSYTWPIAGKHDTVRYWNVMYITYTRKFSGFLTHMHTCIVNIIKELEYHAAYPCCAWWVSPLWFWALHMYLTCINMQTKPYMHIHICTLSFYSPYHPRQVVSVWSCYQTRQVLGSDCTLPYTPPPYSKRRQESDLLWHLLS